MSILDVEYGKKMKIMENEKHTLDDLKNDKITKKREKQKCTLKDL